MMFKFKLPQRKGKESLKMVWSNRHDTCSIIKNRIFCGYQTTNPSYTYVTKASKPMILYIDSYVQKERMDQRINNQDSNTHLYTCLVVFPVIFFLPPSFTHSYTCILMARCWTSHHSQVLEVGHLLVGHYIWKFLLLCINFFV